MRVRIGYLEPDLHNSIEALRADPGPIRAARRIVEQALIRGETLYGINTGFGVLAHKRIEPDQIRQLQRNLILSHAVGVGSPVIPEVSRLMLELKIHALGLGFSGISETTFRRLLDFCRLGLVPVVPSRGSVGASGDLAPLAHMALPLLGLGSFWDSTGSSPIPARQVLAEAGLQPIELQPKDGLSLINGTQFMSAHGAWVLEKSLRLVKIADIVAAMSLEALQGSVRPFDTRIQEIRPHAGQRQAADNVRLLLTDSQILESHRHCGKIQDPYSLRCVPQVHGASRDAVSYACGVVETEINSVTDNPLVFPDGDIISGGNFHGQPLAIAMDVTAIALAELASISERRTYLLLGGHDGLPSLLMRETGVNSGFMIPQYTAAALVSENKVLCHPASVDSIPTSLGQEDHQSMGSISAVKLEQVFRNVEMVLAIELLTAAQALDFRKPLRPGKGVEGAHDFVRQSIPHREQDAGFEELLDQAWQLTRQARLVEVAEQAVGRLA